jgi:alkylation response protein AidB-like acyl-CoA dehydrogenase
MISFELNETQEAIRDAARKFAEEEIAPGVLERDAREIFPKEIVKQLAELGFLGMMVDPEYNGSGLDAVSYSLALEEFCKVEASIGTILSVHNSLVNWIFEHFGNDDQKENVLKKLALGELLGAYCLSEPEAGSDATQQHTLAEKTADGWVLNGMKNWISQGQTADINVVFAQTDPEKRHKGIACFYVEKGTPGWIPQKKEEKMGMRASDTTAIAIANCLVPESNMIGGPTDGFKIAMESLNGGRIGIASQGLGIAQGAFEASVKYALERKAFGKPIIEHQMIQAKLAEMSTKIEAARLLVWKAARMKDLHQNYIQASAEAKFFATSVANEVTREAVQIHGGYGYVREYHVERMMRDAKVTEIYEGTSEIQRIVIARELMKKFG